jgi:hypothetical protein
MTTDWRETTPCPHCGVPVSTEQPIKAWIRKHEDLDSRRHCLCIGDSDLWVQKYGERRWHNGVDRSAMNLMLIEIKTHARDLNDPQRDLLYIVDQVVRTKAWKDQRVNGRFVPGHQQNVRLVYSVMAGRKVPVYCYGVHKLRISGATPDASDWMTWDDKPIGWDQLPQLLRFDLHPDSLRPLEHRSHKRQVAEPAALFGLEMLLKEQAPDDEGAG